jgi:hypothetical protein
LSSSWSVSLKIFCSLLVLIRILLDSFLSSRVLVDKQNYMLDHCCYSFRASCSEWDLRYQFAFKRKRNNNNIVKLPFCIVLIIRRCNETGSNQLWRRSNDDPFSISNFWERKMISLRYCRIVLLHPHHSRQLWQWRMDWWGRLLCYHFQHWETVIHWYRYPETFLLLSGYREQGINFKVTIVILKFFHAFLE